MSQLVLHANNIDEITQAELLSLLILRTSVFIVEQNCPYQDADGFDHQAIHIWFEDENGIAACTRALPPHTRFEEASIGRIITAPEYRGKGLGLKIVKAAVEEARKRFDTDRIRIEAQTYAIPLYEKAGFEVCSEPFLEDGIEHVEMILNLQDIQDLC